MPDVAAVANNIEIYFNGNPAPVAGTSAAAPLWAGFMALVNQAVGQRGLNSIGFANPTLYSIAKSSQYSFAFNDVTTGSTSNSGFSYSSTPGYDFTTGLGTPKCGLIEAIVQPPPLCPTEVQANTNLNQSTTTFKWWTPANIDHLTIKRNGVALPSGLLVFADGRSILPPTTTSETVPFDQDYLATYNICTVATDTQSCCAAPVTPTRSLCVEVAKCRVHGREVLPTDTDDPKTWCSDIGGRIDHFLECSTSGHGTTDTLKR
jgi:hypothetical protein